MGNTWRKYHCGFLQTLMFIVNTINGSSNKSLSFYEQLKNSMSAPPPPKKKREKKTQQKTNTPPPPKKKPHKKTPQKTTKRDVKLSRHPFLFMKIFTSTNFIWILRILTYCCPTPGKYCFLTLKQWLIPNTLNSNYLTKLHTYKINRSHFDKAKYQ